MPVHLALPGLVCVSTCVCLEDSGEGALGMGLEATAGSGQGSALPQFRPD